MPGPSPGMDEFAVGRVVPVVMAKPANNRGELLLELLSEEIPARMQRRGLRDLIKRLTEALQNEELEADNVKGYVTPRRLTVIATGLPENQSDFFEERRGPRVNAPEAARAGFARSAGVALTDLIERDGYFYAEIVRAGRPALDVLPKVVLEAIEETVWSKSMRFPAAPIHWVRPLTSILCLFDGSIVSLSLGDVPVGRTTRGHRFLSPGEMSVENVQDYLDKLKAAYVILDQDRRREKIEADLKERATTERLTVKNDPDLLDEVTGLAEFPVVLIGVIDDASMALPPEVLATAMRTHQKYFSCLKPDGSLAPRFLFVANNLTPDDGKTIVAGNERVLRARLADARFFWDQDRKVPLASRVEALKDRVYYEKLGSVYDKVERMKIIAFQLASFLQTHIALATEDGRLNTPGFIADPREAQQLVERAALLAKADLSTGMVGEFPELQGVMGQHYALHDDEDKRVANAIADHYKPLGPRDSLPRAPISIVVALADKLESLIGFFAIDEKPTGSRDPFALRRAALGVIRLIRENVLCLPLRQTIDIASSAFPQTNYGQRDIKPDLLPFIEERVKVYLREEGVRHDLIDAVFALKEDDLVRLLARVSALRAFLNTDVGTNLLIAYRRAANIVAIEEKRDGRSYGAAVNLSLLKVPEEQILVTSLDEASARAGAAVASQDFAKAMMALATLRRPVDEFFEKVTVNADDPALRENRLCLLSRIRAVMNQVADFSQIEG